MKIDNYIFHGCCHGCTMQQKYGLGVCTGCMYFENDWSKPNLNDHTKHEADERERIKNLARALASKN